MQAPQYQVMVPGVPVFPGTGHCSAQLHPWGMSKQRPTQKPVGGQQKPMEKMQRTVVGNLFCIVVAPGENHSHRED